MQQSLTQLSAVVPTADSMTLEFLTWIARRPRTYSETMEAWRTACPRFPVWEDAHSAGLVRVARPKQLDSPTEVVLTARGRALIEPNCP